MRTRATCLFVLASALVAGCGEIDELLTFSISDQTSFTVESTSPLDLPVTIATPEVTTNSSQKFENNNTNASLVKDVKLEELRLTITSPTGKTFSFLNSIHLYISTDSQNEIELAYRDDIPADAMVQLITTTEKLDAYVKASSYKLRTVVVTDEALAEPVDIQADIKFKVTAAGL